MAREIIIAPRAAIQRVFQLKCDEGSTATCFAIDLNGEEYLCTARHCMQSFAGDSIEVFRDGRWEPLPVKLVGYGSHDSDVCVLAPSTRLVENNLPPLTPAKTSTIGQEGFFFGFPFGMRMDSSELNRGYPFPFVKRATLSAFLDDSNQRTLALDGHNNPGFSGGPFVICNVSDGGERKWCVSAVVSSYRYERDHVLDVNERETEYQVKSNTGIIYACDIKHALDVIRGG